MPVYLGRVLHYDARLVALAQNAGIATLSVGLLAVAWLGDRVPRRHLLTAGATLLLLGSWPWYSAAAGHLVPLIPLLMIAGLGASFATGVFGAVVADLFPTRLRFSGVALSYNASFTAFSGTAPLLATAAIAATGMVGAPACGVRLSTPPGAAWARIDRPLPRRGGNHTRLGTGRPPDGNARGGTRTRTPLPVGDFESPASTDSAIRADRQIYPFHS